MFGPGRRPIRQAFLPLFLLLSVVCFVSAAPTAPAPAHPPDPALETVGRLGIESIPVAVGVKIEQIAGVDQKAENFTAVISTVMRYRDPALAYEPKAGDPPFRMFRIERFFRYAEDRNAYWPAI